MTVPSLSITFCRVRFRFPHPGNGVNGYRSEIRPSSALRSEGHHPPHRNPTASAASSAPRSTPVCPPDTILLSAISLALPPVGHQSSRELINHGDNAY